MWVPIFSRKLRFDVPDDGLPCIDDFIATFESILMGGIELGREPIDCTMPRLGGLNITRCLSDWLCFRFVIISIVKIFLGSSLQISGHALLLLLTRSRASPVRAL